MNDDQKKLPEELLAALPENRTATGPEVDDARQAEEAPSAAEAPPEAVLAPRLTGRRRGRRGGKRLVLPKEPGARNFSPQERLLILDTWRRSGLPAGDFAALVDMSKHTLYAWKKAFDQQGPAGLMDQPRGAKAGSHLPELTKRAILMLKQANPDWGCQRISDALARGPALPASAAAVSKLLHESGYELEEVATRPHPDKVRSFERAAHSR
jgi:transposase